MTRKRYISGMKMPFGSFLRQLRKAQRRSQAQTAQAAGIARITLNRWETGVQQPRLAELEALLTTLKVGAEQRQTVAAALDTPAVRTQTRQTVARIGEQAGIGPMPAGGDLLRALRNRKRLRQEETAFRVGVATRTLQRWEKTEVWPSVEQLHTLCYVLDASEDEIIALTCGRFSQLSSQASPLLEELRILLWAEQSTITELKMLTLEAQVWPMAARGKGGQQLLAEVYAQYANFLSNQKQYGESARYAERCLQLATESSRPERFSLYAVLALAHSAVYRRALPAPEPGIEMLRRWLSSARWPDIHAWMLDALGEYEMLRGNSENALVLSRQSCKVAAASENSIELYLRELSYARLLLQAGRAEEALPMLRIEEKEHPGRAVEVAFLRVKAHLAVGARAEAHDWLLCAQKIITAHDFTTLRPELEALTRQF